MKYISYINELFRNEINKTESFVLYGQNVSTGSCLSGLTRDFQKIKGCNIFNTPNTENALVGMGFGLMLGGISSSFFMKQQDFLLLGIDHLRNTNNFIRQQAPSASFTIVNITMDAGYEGIQASLNNLSDFCAIAGCEGYTISSRQDADLIIKKHFVKPGFRIISISQRFFNTEILDLKYRSSQKDNLIIKCMQGRDVTVACFNFSLPQGKQLCDELNQIGITSSLFSITAAHPVTYRSILKDAKKTGSLVIIDDSKCHISISNLLEIEALRSGISKVCIFKRFITEDSYRPISDVFNVSFKDVVQQLNLP